MTVGMTPFAGWMALLSKIADGGGGASGCAVPAEKLNREERRVGHQLACEHSTTLTSISSSQ